MDEVKIRNLLPAGSVVLIRNAQHALMIYGVIQRDNATGKVFDYISVLWPEGNGGEGTQFLFNHEDIVKVLFKGLNLLERDRFIEGLIELERQSPSDAETKEG